MSKRIPLALPAPVTREDWIKHFVDHHKRVLGAPSPDDMRKYIGVFLMSLNDHHDLHVHFHVGHEHKGDLIVPGRLK